MKKIIVTLPSLLLLMVGLSTSSLAANQCDPGYDSKLTWYKLTDTDAGRYWKRTAKHSRCIKVYTSKNKKYGDVQLGLYSEKGKPLKYAFIGPGESRKTLNVIFPKDHEFRVIWNARRGQEACIAVSRPRDEIECQAKAAAYDYKWRKAR